MAKTRLQEVRVTESKFADDVCNHKEGLEQVGGEFITTVVEWSLTVNTTMGRELRPEDNLPVQPGEISLTLGVTSTEMVK